MIPKNQLDAIQASAYRKIVAAFEATPGWAQHDFEYLGNRVVDVMEETKSKLAKVDFNVEVVLLELARNRYTRLPNTQFVYWSQQKHPKLEFANGREEYAWSHEAVRSFPLNNDLHDALAEIEASLFSTDDKMIVFWRGDHATGPWQVMHSAAPDKVSFVLEYCTAYIYDDEVHHEARPTPQACIPPVTQIRTSELLQRGHKYWTDYEEKK